ncbi:MAG TPA: hypothetical protein VES88_01570 [Gemmatimonadaceae bacterium]|nr:hypothetical protein [Gemmatimonadaceae bacterium]
MRISALFGCAVLVIACSTKEAPPVADTTAIAPAVAPAMSLASIAGTWTVIMKPEGKDTVVSQYLLDTRDSTAWTITFPNGLRAAMRRTGMSGDTVLAATDWNESPIRKGLQARSDIKYWMHDGKLAGTHLAHYKTTGPDTIRVFVVEGTRQ